jgi:hypothetical protein
LKQVEDEIREHFNRKIDSCAVEEKENNEIKIEKFLSTAISGHNGRFQFHNGRRPKLNVFLHYDLLKLLGHPQGYPRISVTTLSKYLEWEIITLKRTSGQNQQRNSAHLHFVVYRTILLRSKGRYDLEKGCPL